MVPRAGSLLPSVRMAVVIASDLGKDIAGEPLLRGISFKLERRDRMTLSGRNGAGKTTLLRVLAGEASVDAGELVLAKGVRVALHDQRPPRERGISLRDYVLSGARELVAIERELASLEEAMAGGAHDEATLNRYCGGPGAARARRRLPLARARAFDAAWARVPRRHRPGPLAEYVLGRRADPCLAGPRARGQPRPAAARRADQPPRHRVARVARAAPGGARRRRRAGCARPLVPGGGRHLRARARGRSGAILPGIVARVAARAAPPGSWRWVERSSDRRPRSPAWSGS